MWRVLALPWLAAIGLAGCDDVGTSIAAAICSDQCTAGATMCEGTGVSTCKALATGCTDWDTPIACDSPPASTCLDDTTLDAVEPTGTCASGACVYASQPQVCAVGSCNQDACRLDLSVAVTLPPFAITTHLGSADDGRVCAAGWFAAASDFGDGHPIASMGNADAFVACYQPSGALIWVKTFGGQNADFINDMVVTGDGTVYVAGQYYAMPLLTPDFLSNAREEDAFLSRLAPDGSVRWLTSVSSLGADGPSTLRVAPTGEVIVAGRTANWLNRTSSHAHEWLPPDTSRLSTFNHNLTYLATLDGATGARTELRLFQPALNGEPPSGMVALALDPEGWVVVAQPAWVSYINTSWTTTRLLSRYTFPSAPVAAIQSVDVTASHGLIETGWIERTYKMLTFDATGASTTLAQFAHQVKAPAGGFSVGPITLGWSQLCYSDFSIQGVPRGDVAPAGVPPAGCFMVFSPTGALQELHSLRGAGTNRFEGVHAVHQDAGGLWIAAGLSGAVNIGNQWIDAGARSEVILQRALPR